MDSWSKVDYSRFIRETSMVVEKLPEVNPPSGRVPGRGLQTLPILEARRRRNRGEITKKGSVLKGFGGLGKYRRRGQPGGTRGPGTPLARPNTRARWEGAWSPGGSPPPPLGTPEASVALIFYIFSWNFSGILRNGKT